MPKIWDLPHVGTLAGDMRIPVDKTGDGTANDTAHFTPDDIVEYVEANAELAPGAHAASHATGGSDPITPASIGAATIAEAGNALTAAQNAQTTADDAASAATAAQGTADNAVTAAGTAQTTADAAQTTAEQWAHPPIVATIDDTDSPFTVLPEHAGGIIRVDTSGDVVVVNMPPALATTRPFRIAIELIDDSNGAEVTSDGVLTFYPSEQTEVSVGSLGITYITLTSPTRGSVVMDLEAWAEANTATDLATAAIGVANAALPKPGGTTTANGIAYGTGTAGAAVAISTTTLADLVKRLGNVFTLSASTVLDDSYSGGVIFTDTSGGARSHTIPTTVSAGWNAIFVREGANTLNIIGDGTMLMAGPAAVANAVAIAVDNGGVSVIRRSATKCWCAGVIA